MAERFKEWKAPDIKEGELTKWNWMVQHADRLKLGKHVDIGAFTYINAKNGITIGDRCQIGSHCSLYTVDTIGGKDGPITMEDGSCLGTHSTIMPGVTIGKDAIVGAHSLVLTDIPSGCIAHGAPAKVVKERETP